MLRSSDARWSSALIGLGALVAAGMVATTLAVVDELDTVRRHDDRAATLAAAQLSGELGERIGGFRGVDVVGVGGRFGAAEFDAFASGLVGDSLFPALAFAEVVAADERDSFVERTGFTIVDNDGAGGFVPAQIRDESFVVSAVYPPTEPTTRVLGFDLASDPVRRSAVEAAERSTTPVISDRTDTALSAQAGVSVMQVVRGPDGDTIGFVTSGFPVTDVVEAAGIDPGAFADFGLSMDDEVLVGTPGVGASQSFEVAGRRFEVSVEAGRALDLFWPIVIGLGTAVLAATVVWTAVRDRRQRRRLARNARRNWEIAALGQHLAVAGGVDDVLAALAAHAGGIVDATTTVVARRRLPDPDTLELHRSHANHELGFELAEATLMDCLGSCVRDARSMEVADLDQEPGDDTSGTTSSSGRRAGGSLVCVPLLIGDGYSAGAIAFAWSPQLTATELEEHSSAALTVAELAGRTLERAVITEAVQTGAGNLGLLARALAGAHTADDVGVAARTHVAAIVGADTAELHTDDDASLPSPAVGTVHRSVIDEAGRPVATLTVTWAVEMALGPTHHAVLSTVADLIGQTLTRTKRSEDEHHVIVELQRALLPRPHPIEGMELAVRYRPAMNMVGLGGDFHDVINSDDGRTYLVIGDISGHGYEAVAAMAELKSVVRHLLWSGVGIEHVYAQADLIASRRGVLATAQLIELDPAADTLRYLNAGHPYPIRLDATGTCDVLRDGHRRLLGLDGARTDHLHADVAETSFVVGDVLVLYTDGLIEQRSHTIDASVSDLVDTVRDAPAGSMDGLVDHLLEANIRRRTDRSVDDDIALLAVRRLA